MITLITLTQGNPIALQRTIDNVGEWFGNLLSQVIVGDLCVVDDLNEHLIYTEIIQYKFNHLFHNGFASVLNDLSRYSTNDICLYMNVGEVIEGNINLTQFQPQYNVWNFNHATDPHRWGRMWRKSQLQWSGRIHEELIGNKVLAPANIFTMADTEKDNFDAFYSAVMNDIKELVYFNQYLALVNKPAEIGATNAGWVKYAKDNYQHIKDRLIAKGARYDAFIEGDLKKYLDNCTEFQPHNNSDLIHFQ